MTRARLFSAAAVLLTCLAGSTAAQAELVFFQSGRALSVKKYRFEGENLVLTLRSGGGGFCSGRVSSRNEADGGPDPPGVVLPLRATQAPLSPPPHPPALPRHTSLGHPPP